MVFQGELEHQDKLDPMENMAPRGRKDSLDLQVGGGGGGGGATYIRWGKSSCPGVTGTN